MFPVSYKVEFETMKKRLEQKQIVESLSNFTVHRRPLRPIICAGKYGGNKKDTRLNINFNNIILLLD
jgi:hypothetical protein